MNIGAIVLIAGGFLIVIVGWNGSYAQVWQYISGQAAPSSSSNAPSMKTQQPGQTAGQQPGGNTPSSPTYTLALGAHQ